VRYSSFRSFVVAAGLATLASTAVPAQAPVPATDPFTSATREYSLMHRRIEETLRPLVVTASPAELLANVNALGDAIRLERADRQQGDLFTPQLSEELRRTIASALAAKGLSPADLATDEVPEGIDRRLLVLRVGGPVPWVVGTNMLTCTLDVLPPLPPELQYRFVFRDLVLVDVHANVIVDFLPEALAARE
jgi:hypothetical protein